MVRKEPRKLDSLRLYQADTTGDLNMWSSLPSRRLAVPTRSELIKARQDARAAKKQDKLSQILAQKAEEERLLAEFLARRDDAIRVEQENLELLVADWWRRNEAKAKTN